MFAFDFLDFQCAVVGTDGVEEPIREFRLIGFGALVQHGLVICGAGGEVF